MKMVKFTDFSRPHMNFFNTLVAYLVLKDFSRKPSMFKYFSSLCEPWYICNVTLQT